MSHCVCLLHFTSAHICCCVQNSFLRFASCDKTHFPQPSRSACPVAMGKIAKRDWANFDASMLKEEWREMMKNQTWLEVRAEVYKYSDHARKATKKDLARICKEFLDENNKRKKCKVAHSQVSIEEAPPMPAEDKPSEDSKGKLSSKGSKRSSSARSSKKSQNKSVSGKSPSNTSKKSKASKASKKSASSKISAKAKTQVRGGRTYGPVPNSKFKITLEDMKKLINRFWLVFLCVNVSHIVHNKYQKLYFAHIEHICTRFDENAPQDGDVQGSTRRNFCSLMGAHLNIMRRMDLPG